MGLTEDERAKRVHELTAKREREAHEKDAVKRRIAEDAVRGLSPLVANRALTTKLRSSWARSRTHAAPCLPQAERRARLAGSSAAAAAAAALVSPSLSLLSPAGTSSGTLVQLRVTAEDGRVLRGTFDSEETLSGGE